MQRLADELDAAKVDALLRKWLARLPHPFTAADRAAGMRYDVSVLQAEFALTQVLDRPVQGRVLFEEIIRENVDLRHPDHVQLIFDRRVTKRTPSRYRTRVITEGVAPSLHVDHKHSRIKQYHKEGRALRTETVVNETYDFDVGRRLKNLGALRAIGFAANRRLLRAQRLSHDCAIGAERFDDLHRPRTVDGQRASALRFGDQRAHALLAALLAFRLLPEGFRNRDLRPVVAPLIGLSPENTLADALYRSGGGNFATRAERDFLFGSRQILIKVYQSAFSGVIKGDVATLPWNNTSVPLAVGSCTGKTHGPGTPTANAAVRRWPEVAGVTGNGVRRRI